VAVGPSRTPPLPLAPDVALECGAPGTPQGADACFADPVAMTFLAEGSPAVVPPAPEEGGFRSSLLAFLGTAAVLGGCFAQGLAQEEDRRGRGPDVFGN
jgi:hypothetical protein